MADIATLGVRVTTTGVKEAERDLKGLTTEGAKAEQQADKVGAAWGKRLGVAVLAGTAIAGAGIARIIKNTIEAERVQAQLAARIRSTGGAAGLAVADLNKMADALQAATTFDDEAIGGAQAVLLTFTKIGRDVFPLATEAVLNLSTALGTDLNSASLQVGKALQDPVKGISALARAGVQFTEAQKDTIEALVETGQQAEAQRIILAELETQIGGSARAARETLGGALQALSNAFDNALEGDSGGDGARGLTQAVNDLTDTLSSEETKQGFATVVEWLVNITKFAAETIAMLGGVAAAVNRTFQSIDERNMQGLVDAQIDLEKDIAAVESGGLAAATRGATTPGTFIDLLESREANLTRLRGLLDDVIQRQNKLTGQENGAAIAAQQGGSSGSPNGRGRGVRGDSSAAALSAESQELIDKLTEEAAAYGLSKSALLEREKAQAVAAATSQKEREALTASYDALIGKVKADEMAKAASSGAAAATRDAAQAERERQAVIADGLRAQDALTEQVRQNAADLAGPAAQAAKAYADELLDLLVVEERLRAANLLTADSEREIALAREQAAEGYQRNLEAIDSQLTAAEQLIEDLEFEKKLRGLSNLEMQKEIALRYAGADATDEQRAAIVRLIEEQDEAMRVAEGLDVVRDSTRGLFEDLMDGSKSASDAFKDFVDNILDGIAQIVARNLTEQLLGSFGSTGGGASGGGLASLFGSFFSGGRAIGGPVSGGGLYRVAEKGEPELLNVYGKQYLIPGANGQVTPAADNTRSPGRQVKRGGDMTIVVQGATSERAIGRMRTELSRSLQKSRAEIS